MRRHGPRPSPSAAPRSAPPLVRRRPSFGAAARSALPLVRRCRSFGAAARSALPLVRRCRSFGAAARSALPLVRRCRSFGAAARSALPLVRRCRSFGAAARSALSARPLVEMQLSGVRGSREPAELHLDAGLPCECRPGASARPPRLVPLSGWVRGPAPAAARPDRLTLWSPCPGRRAVRRAQPVRLPAAVTTRFSAAGGPAGVALCAARLASSSQVVGGQPMFVEYPVRRFVRRVPVGPAPVPVVGRRDAAQGELWISVPRCAASRRRRWSGRGVDGRWGGVRRPGGSEPSMPTRTEMQLSGVRGSSEPAELHFGVGTAAARPLGVRGRAAVGVSGQDRLRIHSSRWGASSPMVVGSPCPVRTRVSAGRVSRVVRMDSMMVSNDE